MTFQGLRIVLRGVCPLQAEGPLNYVYMVLV